MAKKSETHDPFVQGSEPKASKGAPSAEQTFQEQFDDLEDTVGIAGTNMTAQEAEDLVEAGEGDTLAEHGPETPPPEEDATKAPAAKTPKKEHDPFRD